jgi:uncharacterized damage-inducible protein DinB
MPEQALETAISRLARTPEMLSAWLYELPDEAWRANEGAQTWSPFQVLCHLIHGEDDDWIPRIRIVLADPGPGRFTTFDREAGFVTYGSHAPSALLELFATKRRASLTTLAELPISSAALARRAIHPELGEVTLAQLLACWLTHDAAHVAQIARVLVRYHGTAIGPWRAFFRDLRTEPDA